MFNEYEMFEMMKLRQEEIEKNARNAWKIEGFQKESFFQRIIQKLKSSQKSPAVKTNCDCVCNC